MIHILCLQGHDTTAIAICFALSLLAEHKDIQVFLDIDKHHNYTKELINFINLINYL